MFKRRLDQLTDAVEASLNFRKNNDYGSAKRDQQCSRPPQFRESKRSFSSVPNLHPRRKMLPNTLQYSCFPARSTTRTDSENLCFFHARFGAKAQKCVQRHVLGNRVILVTSMITLITAWHPIAAVHERSFCQRVSLFFTTLVQTCAFSLTRVLKSV